MGLELFGIRNLIREYRVQVLARQAVAWRDLLVAGNEHNAAFAAWLLRSEDHMRVWHELTAFDQKLVKFVESPEGHLVFREARARDRARPAIERPVRTLLVALGLSCVLAWPVWEFIRIVRFSTAGEISTRIGEHKQRTLKDGTVVYLNTNSTMRWSYTPTERVVTLDSGELLVKVHDDARPFGVYHGRMLIRDVGTSYSVRARGPETDITVFDGEVALESLDRREALTTVLPGVQRMVLRRGQTASIPSAGKAHVQNLDAAVLERRRAWTYGRLQFKNDTLESIVTEFNRYNTRQLRLENPCLLEMRTSGSFEPTDVESFVESLPVLGISEFRMREREDEVLIDGECP